MRAVLWRNFPRSLDYELHLVSDRPGGGKLTHASGVDDRGHIIWATEPVSDGYLPEKPLLWLPEDAVHAVAQAFGEITQASDATVGHLKDAIAVRDRLLTMVERP